MSTIQKMFKNIPTSRHMAPIDWSQAKCHGFNNIYFDQSRSDREQARDLCDKCPIKFECGIYGLSQVYGMWGGISESQRRKISITKTIVMCPTCLYNRLIIRCDEICAQICPQCGISYLVD